MRTRLAWMLVGLGAVGVPGCYQSHLGDDVERCGSEICTEGNRCCTTCGVERCVTLDLPCPVEMCDACTSDADCGAERYCRFPEGACGGRGECAEFPEGCFGDCPGVCGCDGADYCNACEAARAGVSVEHRGSCGGEACGAAGLVCGEDETCCPLCEGEAICVGPFAPCPEVECPGGCLGSADCAPDEWCDFPDGLCGAGAVGTCQPIPAGCDDDCPGVCGCDGALHCNECVAAGAGSDVGPPGSCDMPCGRGGEICDPGEYCDLGASCGALDGETCAPRPTACPDVEDPVCGCDGLTYGNRCEANASGMTVASMGPCDPCPGGVCARSCRELQAASPGVPSGEYMIQPVPGELHRVHCDMETDGGGWTLVASTLGVTMNDERGAYHADLGSPRPSAAHAGVWDGLRFVAPMISDVRFTCGSTSDPDFRVDLSFYDVIWYGEWIQGSDADSCFSEQNGVGFDRPAPARRDNLAGVSVPVGADWAAGYLEGEDTCGDTGDFTVDLRDRGMDSNQTDGTDWGEDDGSQKYGFSTLAESGF